MAVITHWFSNVFLDIGPFFILLGLLIFVHELGHFLVAKWCGVRVEVFSLGFGKKILQYKKGDTNYCISIIPLGGYVKMFGDDPTKEVGEEDQPYAFLHKSVWQRIAVVLAGPFMNLFFAAVLFMAIGRIGEPYPKAQVGDLTQTSQAYKDGFRAGDQILSVNGQPVSNWVDVKKQINGSADEKMTFEIQRDSKTQNIVATPVLAANDNIFSLHSKIGEINGLTIESKSSVIGVPQQTSLAAHSGLKTLDLILAVNKEPVSFWRDLEPVIKHQLAAGAKTLTFKVRQVDTDETEKNVRYIKIPASDIHPAAGESLARAIGLESSELYVLKVKPKSPAAEAGLQAKDRLVAINGAKVQSWSDVLNGVKTYHSGSKPLHIVISRQGLEKSIEVQPELTDLMNRKGQEEQRFTIGIVSAYIKVGPDTITKVLTSPIEILKAGVVNSAEWTEFIAMSMVRMVQGQVSARNIGGVIAIGRVASHSFSAGLSQFLKIMAIISINLFLLNLLPIPVLDGGHLVFFSVEAIKGSPISLKKMEVAQQVGVTLLMLLMVFSIVNDLTNYFTSR